MEKRTQTNMQMEKYISKFTRAKIEYNLLRSLFRENDYIHLYKGVESVFNSGGRGICFKRNRSTFKIKGVDYPTYSSISEVIRESLVKKYLGLKVYYGNFLFEFPFVFIGSLFTNTVQGKELFESGKIKRKWNYTERELDNEKEIFEILNKQLEMEVVEQISILKYNDGNGYGALYRIKTDALYNIRLSELLVYYKLWLLFDGRKGETIYQTLTALSKQCGYWIKLMEDLGLEKSIGNVNPDNFLLVKRREKFFVFPVDHTSTERNNNVSYTRHRINIANFMAYTIEPIISTIEKAEKVRKKFFQEIKEGYGGEIRPAFIPFFGNIKGFDEAWAHSSSIFEDYTRFVISIKKEFPYLPKGSLYDFARGMIREKQHLPNLQIGKFIHCENKG